MTARSVRLNEIAEISLGFAFKSAKFSKDGTGTRLLRGDNIVQGTTRWNRAELWPDENAADPRYQLAEDDVVLAMDRPWIEAGLKFAKIQAADLPSLLVQRVARLRVKAGHDQRFLAAIIGSRRFSGYVLSVQTGTAVPHISGGQIGNYSFEIPTLALQMAIADVLGALDDKIAANNRIASSAAVLASTIYGREVVGRQERAMSDILTPILGGTPARSEAQFWTGTNLWASARDVTGADHGIIVETVEKISASAIQKTKAKPLPKGSVILTARGTVGAVARLGVASSFNQSCYGFEPGKLPAGVLYFAILNATERAKAFAHGSVFDTITMKTFEHLTVPDLSRVELDAIEAQIRPLLEAVNLAVGENRTLAATRDALLPQLMSGKLRVKDAEKSLAGVL